MVRSWHQSSMHPNISFNISVKVCLICFLLSFPKPFRIILSLHISSFKLAIFLTTFWYILLICLKSFLFSLFNSTRDFISALRQFGLYIMFKNFIFSHTVICSLTPSCYQATKKICLIIISASQHLLSHYHWCYFKGCVENIHKYL